MKRVWGAAERPVLPNMKDGPCINMLRGRLRYDDATGEFFWQQKPTNHVDLGSPAGTLDAKGYVLIKLQQRRYSAHRLAWLWVHGEWPSLLVDHIDGNRSNNKISNLRLATASENARNNSKSRERGYSSRIVGGGVSRERFRARINIGGKNIHLGSFDTEAEAYACYERALEVYKRGDERAAPASMGAQR